MRRHVVRLLDRGFCCLFVALIFDDVFSVKLKWLLLMSLSNSGFCVDVVCIYLGFVAGVFE